MYTTSTYLKGNQYIYIINSFLINIRILNDEHNYAKCYCDKLNYQNVFFSGDMIFIDIIQLLLIKKEKNKTQEMTNSLSQFGEY